MTCADDPGAAGLEAARTVRYGTVKTADGRISERDVRPDGQSFLLAGPTGRARVALRLPGAHNALNAAGAILAAVACGVPLGRAADAFHSFEGTARRLEVIGRAAGVTVVDDYAHHPAELRASIEAMRPRVAPGGRLFAVFQPHTPSRLTAFFDDFAAALRDADERIVVETFASAREHAGGGLAQRLAQRAGGRYAPDAVAAARDLAGRVRRGDLVLILGAGDVRAAGERLLADLAAGSPA